jgi:hypothetical protein
MVGIRRRGSDRVTTAPGRMSRWWLPLPALGLLWLGSLHAAPVPSEPAADPAAGAPTSMVGAPREVSPHAATTARHGSARRLAVLPNAVPMVRVSQDTHPQAGGGSDVVGAILADAYGANVEFLGTCVSCTTAQAGPNASGAEGREVRLAGEPLSEGQVPSNGYSGGALLALPQNPLLRLVIGDWDGWTTADRNASRAHARGALLQLAPADGSAATVSAGESSSDASYSERASHGRSESNGLRAGLMSGRIALVVLHSESSSDSAGRVFVASLNGQEIPQPASGANGHQGVTVPGVAYVSVLQSDGASAVIGSASDGRSQRIVGAGSTRVGSPVADPQRLM